MKLFTPTKVWVLLTITFITPFCGFLFKCGCTFVWSGAASHCNIYTKGPLGCPWCQPTSSLLLSIPALFLIAGEWLSIYLVTDKLKKSYPWGLFAGFLAFVVFGFLLAYAYSLIYDYPFGLI